MTENFNCGYVNFNCGYVNCYKEKKDWQGNYLKKNISKQLALKGVTWCEMYMYKMSCPGNGQGSWQCIDTNFLPRAHNYFSQIL